jgi:hypothetical protein
MFLKIARLCGMYVDLGLSVRCSTTCIYSKSIDGLIGFVLCHHIPCILTETIGLLHLGLTTEIISHKKLWQFLRNLCFHELYHLYLNFNSRFYFTVCHQTTNCANSFATRAFRIVVSLRMAYHKPKRVALLGT